MKTLPIQISLEDSGVKGYNFEQDQGRISLRLFARGLLFSLRYLDAGPLGIVEFCRRMNAVEHCQGPPDCQGARHFSIKL
jgi:hypothetical protein